MKFWNAKRAGLLAEMPEGTSPPPPSAAALAITQCADGVLITDMRMRGQTWQL